jgi:GTPase SAR1 family protein
VPLLWWVQNGPKSHIFLRGLVLQSGYSRKRAALPQIADGDMTVAPGTPLRFEQLEPRAARSPDASFLSALLTVESIASRENAEPIRRRLADLRQRVEQDRFQIAVVGQFKRGKTSVVNALLHRNVLPVDALPFTSVLTVVKYGDEQRAEVILRSGELVSVAVSDLVQYVTESGNPQNVKNVDRVEVSFPSDYLHFGVRLINCPGFGSPSDRNTQAAYEFLPSVDAAIFVTSPDPPLTSAEMEFLKRLSRNTKTIFLVMNKIDLFDAKSLDGLLEFTQSAVSLALGTHTPLYAVSAHRVLTHAIANEPRFDQIPGFRKLESDLQQLLKQERNDVFYGSVLRGLLNCIGDLRVHLKLCLDSASASSSDLKHKRARLEDGLSLVRERHEQNEASLVATVSHLATLVESETARFVESRIPFLYSGLRSYVQDSRRMSKQELMDSVNQFMEFQIQHVLNQWRPDFEISLDRAFRDALTRFLASTNEVTDNIRATACGLFGGNLGSRPIIEEIPTIQGCERTNPIAQRGQEPLCFLLPSPMFRSRVLRSTLRAVPNEFRRAGQFLARSLTGRMDYQTKTFTDRVRNRLLEIAETIRTAVDETLAKNDGSELCADQRSRRLCADISELEQLAEMVRAGLGADYALEA